MTAPRALGAILTGGAARRMHGRLKGLLPGADGQPLARRAAAALAAVDVFPILIGRRAEHAHLGLPALDDTRPGEGPLAALEAALRHAHAAGHPQVLLVACDMPYFTPALLTRLLDAPPAAAVAFRRGEHLEPLLTRYRADLRDEVTARLDSGERGLQPLLRALPALALPLTPDEAPLLDDWDTPEQVR